VLFLDEPFGALDALTRGHLQQELARLCSDLDRLVTTIMITNNVDEALLLSDRIVPMTRGPRATLGTPVPVAMPKPRNAARLTHDEEAMRVRSHVIEALTATCSAGLQSRSSAGLQSCKTAGLKTCATTEDLCLATSRSN